jgi:hypothetical protein
MMKRGEIAKKILEILQAQPAGGAYIKDLADRISALEHEPVTEPLLEAALNVLSSEGHIYREGKNVLLKRTGGAGGAGGDE